MVWCVKIDIAMNFFQGFAMFRNPSHGSDLISGKKNKHSEPLASLTKNVTLSSENFWGVSSKGRCGRLWIVGRNPDGLTDTR